MGFFKRILSLGSSKHRKNKKRQTAANSRVDAEGRIVADNGAQDPDTSANRLLRSSSTKFMVMSEIDYTTLPPLPHSMHDLLTTGTPPLSPSPSLATVATTPGPQRSGTYVVKVHGRTTHSRTEFPRANPPLSPTKSHRTRPSPLEQAPSGGLDVSDDEEEQDEGRPRVALKEVNFTPKDTSRLYKLRRDPSVASLLNLYDERGCLDSAVFENFPPSPISAPQEGRDQAKRSGSTFHQLLGEPEPANFRAAAEGDISWAERFLDEQLGDDSPLSSPSPTLETPTDAHFPDTLSAPRVTADTTFSSLDPDSSMNYPAISSMEVEVSGSEEGVPIVETKPVSRTPLTDPKTPQRASEVFGFLSRRNTLTVKERDLPPIPPSQTLTPELTGETHQSQSDLSANDNSLGEHLDATHSANTSHSTQLTSSDTNSHASHAQIHTATMTKLSSAFAASTTSLNLLLSHDRDEGSHDSQSTSKSKEVPRNYTGTTSTLSTHAASHLTGSSLSSSNSTKVPPSKIPRGPRPRPHSICRQDTLATPETDITPSDMPITIHQRRGSDMNTRSSKREAFTHIPQRQHGRTASSSSTRSKDSVSAKLPAPSSRRSRQSKKRSTKPEQFTIGKENTPSPPPPVPRRSESVVKGESAIPVFGFSTPERHRVLIEPPSRASSSELSPLTRDMMDNLRRQRTRNGERMRAFWTRD